MPSNTQEKKTHMAIFTQAKFLKLVKFIEKLFNTIYIIIYINITHIEIYLVI